jgi:glycosyltransferase involved in cell wall biosynthesis
MNILFVHEVDWFTKVVFDLHSLSELLSKFGHNVVLIDFASLPNRKRLSDFISIKTEEMKIAGRAHNDASIILIRPGIIKAPFLDRATSFFTHYLAIERTIKNNKIDIIVLYSVPTNGYQVIKIAKKYGIPVVFRSLDILHELVPSRIFSPFTFSIETWVYKHSNKILAESPKLAEYVIRMGADKDKVELLLFGVNLSQFNPHVESADLRESLGLCEDDLVILYIGTLFEFSGLDLYLEQFGNVIKKVPKAKLLIVGGGLLFEKLKEQISELGLSDSVILTGFKPFNMMPKFINMANICINPFKVTGATREIIPGKILQYLACGKPVLATPLLGMVSLLSGPEYGIVYSNISRFAEKTIELLDDPKMARAIGENGLRYVADNHDEVKISRRLHTILSQMIKRN